MAWAGLLLFALLMLSPAAHAEPITAAIAAIAAISIGGTTVGAIVSAISVVAGLASAAAGLIGSRKKPSVGNYSFADDAATRTQTVRSPIESHKVIYGRARVGGTLVYVTTSRVDSRRPHGYLHMVIVLAAHEVEEIESIYINDELATFTSPSDTFNGPNFVTNSRYLDRDGTSFIRIIKHTGAADQAADSLLTAAVPQWTSAHRLRGHAYIYVRCLQNQTMFTNGIPNFSAVVKGKKVYDPRSLVTAWSDNWALCVRDYITNSTYGIGADSAFVDDDTFIAAANIADESVTLKAGGTEARYRCNGVVDTADKPIDILKSLTTAGAGVMVYSQGKYKLFAGAYNAPSLTLDESWLSGEVKVQTKTARNELFNAARGVYIDPAQSWQPTDFPIVTNSLYETQDGGHRIERDFELAYTIGSEASQRIAKIALEQGRQGIIIDVPCNLKAMQLSVWDTVYVTLAHFGWAAKVFRVLKWSLDPERGVMLTLQEEAAANYTWNNGEATLYDPAPDTNLPDPLYVAPPGNPVITETLYSTIGSAGVKVQANGTWSPGDESFNAFDIFQYQPTSAGEDDWETVGAFLGGSAVIPDIDPGFYNFRVATVNWRGQRSEWAQTTQEILGLTAPPEDVTGFTLNAIHNQAHLKWESAPDLDVRTGGSIRVKWTPETAAPTWSMGMSISPDLPGVATNAVVPLLTGTYMIKAVDSGGRESVNATLITSNVANLVNMNAVATSQQDSSFPGDKTNMVVDTGVLKLDGSTLFDSASGNFDDASGLFDGGGSGSGGFATTGEYRFEDGLGNNYEDLGDVYLSRVTANVDFTIVDESSTFDEAAGNFDDREGLFDGGDLSDVDLKLYVRTTEDDPAGTPTWTDWREFVVGDYLARAYDFKLSVLSGKTSNNVEISTLRVSIDVPDREERDEDATTSTSADTTITYATPFFQTPNVAITAQNMATGDYVVVSSKTATGFVINTRNAAGSRVARTFDWIARGF